MKDEVSSRTPHNHRCRKCDAVWHHDPAVIHSAATRIECERRNEAAHTCPACGEEQYSIDHTGAEPLFCSNGVRTVPLASGCKLGIVPEHERISPSKLRLMEEFGRLLGAF